VRRLWATLLAVACSATACGADEGLSQEAIVDQYLSEVGEARDAGFASTYEISGTLFAYTVEGRMTWSLREAHGRRIDFVVNDPPEYQGRYSFFESSAERVVCLLDDVTCSADVGLLPDSARLASGIGLPLDAAWQFEPSARLRPEGSGAVSEDARGTCYAFAHSISSNRTPFSFEECFSNRRVTFRAWALGDTRVEYRLTAHDGGPTDAAFLTPPYPVTPIGPLSPP
jgi:hypothetical protein